LQKEKVEEFLTEHQKKKRQQAAPEVEQYIEENFEFDI